MVSEKDKITESDVKVIQLLPLKMEAEYKPSNVRDLGKTGKGRNRES